MRKTVLKETELLALFDSSANASTRWSVERTKWFRFCNSCSDGLSIQSDFDQSIFRSRFWEGLFEVIRNSIKTASAMRHQAVLHFEPHVIAFFVNQNIHRFYFPLLLGSLNLSRRERDA